MKPALPPRPPAPGHPIKSGMTKKRRSLRLFCFLSRRPRPPSVTPSFSRHSRESGNPQPEATPLVNALRAKYRPHGRGAGIQNFRSPARLSVHCSTEHVMRQVEGHTTNASPRRSRRRLLKKAPGLLARQLLRLRDHLVEQRQAALPEIRIVDVHAERGHQLRR